MATSSKHGSRNPRILVVTPEITYLPQGMGNMGNHLTAKAGGLADVSAALVSTLFELGSDIHVALPHYRRMFHIEVANLIEDELRVFKSTLPDTRIHLAEDRIFYYRDSVYGHSDGENPKIALAFQREVINNIIPLVQPDLIHCNDWMTGLIPAAARRRGIPCLFTFHNIHTYDVTLARVEDAGIDAAEFWRYLYYKRIPNNYEESRDSNMVDPLASGIFASHFINTVSPTFLQEIVKGQHDFIPPHLRAEIVNKYNAGCAMGIINAPDQTYNPSTDTYLKQVFTADSHAKGKLANKRAFQALLGLEQRDSAPIFFWPSRLDPVQKGCQLLTHILYETISRYWDDGIQIAVIANGAYQKHFNDVVKFHNLQKRVAVRNFDERLSHIGYAASDFLLMPSLFEPCGLPQMISAMYGSLPVAHDTGGLHDTVVPLNLAEGTGNGFLFEDYDPNGLRWAIDEAMKFHRLPADIKATHLSRIITESATAFSLPAQARQYVSIYENMLHRPLINAF
ncbi:MAG: glycogen/starch synthase [bacterium]